uniref:Signal recognition particle receptor subunit beta n=1 Tax=Anopheles stephensi TaxID=30069 RepID=A0A182Y1E8_ANOST
MEKVNRKSSARASIKLGELDYTPVLIALAVVLLTLVVLFLWKRKKTVRSAVLFTGLCDSGKTFLFTHLCLGGGRETFTSIKENVGSFKTEKGRELKMVDVPGHERLRGKFFDEYKNIAKAIVYMIDSVTVQKDIRDVADTSSESFLGKSAGVDFEFEQLGQRIRFVPCSTKEEKYEGLTSFLESL